MKCREALFEGGGRGAEGQACENHMGLSMYEGFMGTVEYIWVNTWSMLH